MNRLTRITAILTHLQSKKLITAAEIADRFEVSLRTVYRDIKTLQEAGVPIGSENGMGYYLVDGFSLPPIMVTEEEANALIISEKFIQNQGDSSLKRDFSSLLFKIKAVLKSRDKDNISVLENRISPSYPKISMSSDSLSIVQKAITNKKNLRITYRSLGKDEVTNRTVKPLGIYFTSVAWVLIAYCTLRNDKREFRLDKIQTIQTVDDPIEFREEFNLMQYFTEKHAPKLT